MSSSYNLNVKLLCKGFTSHQPRKGHTEMGPLFKVSSERLEKPRIKLETPGLQGE